MAGKYQVHLQGEKQEWQTECGLTFCQLNQSLKRTPPNEIVERTLL